jgi:hypothetical protein
MNLTESWSGPLRKAATYTEQTRRDIYASSGIRTHERVSDILNAVNVYLELLKPFHSSQCCILCKYT